MDELSPRQLECLGLLCQGLTYIEIGRRLNISQKTVQSYLGQAYERLNARNGAHAAYLIAISDLHQQRIAVLESELERHQHELEQLRRMTLAEISRMRRHWLKP